MVIPLSRAVQVSSENLHRKGSIFRLTLDSPAHYAHSFGLFVKIGLRPTSFNPKYFSIMAKKTKKSAEQTAVQTAAPAVEPTPAVTPTAKQGEAPRRANLIVAKRSFNRWYVYFQGLPPSQNVGCGCKTAKSAMRYMHLLKARYGATISQNIYERLQFEAAREA